jgi:transcription initiation factor IIF auxiliary subunit
MKQRYDLRVVDSAIEMDEAGRQLVHYEPRRPGRRTRYKVTIRLAGMDLPYVAAVTYRLHRSFKERTHTVDRTILNPDCALTIWTWGLFVVQVIIHLKSGHQIPLDHELHYDEAIRAAGPNGLQWSASR